MEHEGDGDTNCNWHVQSPKDWLKDWGSGNKRMSGDHPNYSSVEIRKRVLETCCHSVSSEKPSANAGVRTSQMSKINNNNNNWLVFNGISTLVGYLMPNHVIYIIW